MNTFCIAHGSYAIIILLFTVVSGDASCSDSVNQVCDRD